MPGWYPVGTVLAGLYSVSPLNEVVAPPPGMATRLCFSVEYRHSVEQLMVSLLRLANLPPRFHGNVTLVELRLPPDDRRPRQAKARGTGPDPEFSDCFVFQARKITFTEVDTGLEYNYEGKTNVLNACLKPWIHVDYLFLKTVHMFPLQVSGVCVHQSTLSVCVLSVEQDGKRHIVGRVLFPLEGELGHAGRVLWKDLETEDDTQVLVQAENIFTCTRLVEQGRDHSAIARLTVFRAG